MYDLNKKSFDRKVKGPMAPPTTASQESAFKAADSVDVAEEGTEVGAFGSTAEQYLTIEEVAGRYQISRSTVWSWTRTARYGFPKPANLTPSCTRWRLSDLLAWEQHQLSK